VYKHADLVLQIYPYLHNRKACPLSSLAWKTIPWSLHPKSPKDELIDVLIELPGMMEDTSTLKTLSSQPERAYAPYEILQERSSWCEHQLQSWSTTCGEATVAFVEGLIADPDRENDVYMAPPSTDLAMAHLGLIYWTTCNLVSQILSSLEEFASSEKATDLRSQRSDSLIYSRKVALLIPYFNRPGVGSYLISFIGWPVAVATSYLAKYDLAEAQPLLDAAFRGEHGRQLKKFLNSWPWMTMVEMDMLGSAGALDDAVQAPNTGSDEGTVCTEIG
jgi:hypothetical protein